MSQSIIEKYFTPFFDGYTSLIDGGELSYNLQFKGGQEAGTSYISRFYGTLYRQIHKRFDDAHESVQNPTFNRFIGDNLARLFLINPIERVVAAVQAYPTLKARFTQPGSMSHTFTEIMNEGAFFGTMKGISMAFLQLSLVLYPAVYFTNQRGKEHSFLNFLTYYTVYDAALYPIDTIKNILYADTLGQLNLRKVLQNTGVFQFYRGIVCKLLYNVPVLAGIYYNSQQGYEKEALLSWIIAAVVYPLNTFKVRSQVSASPKLSSVTSSEKLLYHSSYRGVVPFIVANAVLGWSLRPLFNQERLDAIYKSVTDQIGEKIGH